MSRLEVRSDIQLAGTEECPQIEVIVHPRQSYVRHRLSFPRGVRYGWPRSRPGYVPRTLAARSGEVVARRPL